MTPEEERALRTARSMLDLGHDLEVILENSLIPAAHRKFVQERLLNETTRVLEPARVIVRDATRADWLSGLDRSGWHYWPALRQYLLSVKGWAQYAVRSLDDSSDRILKQLASPTENSFDIRGLVLGYVQSGKTASFTALIAKAADAGYRLVIVLSGIDNGLRRQTQIRLNKELVGYTDARAGSIRLPPLGRQWVQFTSEDFNGDFRAGNANHGALQGSQPVLLVVKKNGSVLRRLLEWLHAAPESVKNTLPLLVVDDEADQASVDTRGSYQADDEPPDPEYEPPSVINGRIRELLGMFRRCAYVAYTATPFANILIPHNTEDPDVGSDLYPKDFIVDLPRSEGYFGAEQIFGRFGANNEEVVDGLGVIREVTDVDLADLEDFVLPASLEIALLDFVLAGAGRAQRGAANSPATMLIHTSQRITEQAHMSRLVADRFAELRDEWRYARNNGIKNRLKDRWDDDFRAHTRQSHLDRDVAFEVIEEYIGPFFEAVQVKEVNSATGEVLDYEREPTLKAIVVGGNRLSRGLTLEGLLVSFFVRRTVMYDTLMQMGRWFGYRPNYEDLTRIWMTAELEGWFSDLALVEHQLRQDIEIYESQGLTPYQVGMRILQHPTMQITSTLKRRFTTTTTISQSYSLTLQQTFKFPLRRPADLAAQADNNLAATRGFLSGLGPALWDSNRPSWSGVGYQLVLTFLRQFQVDAEIRNISLPLICAYIERLADQRELDRWIVGVCGLQTRDRQLGSADWRVPGGTIWNVSRTRIGESDSVGVITSPGDEAIGLNDETRRPNDEITPIPDEGENRTARRSRSPRFGLLLLYPISRNSGYRLSMQGTRRPLYSNPNDRAAKDLIGLALSFPESGLPQRMEAYLEGTARWRPVE